MKNKLMTILVLFSSLLFIILVFMLPDKIPIHWNVSGEVDGVVACECDCTFVIKDPVE